MFSLSGKRFQCFNPPLEIGHHSFRREHDLLLPKIDLPGKKLFACQSAVKDFKNILKTVGGAREQERTR